MTPVKAAKNYNKVSMNAVGYFIEITIILSGEPKINRLLLRVVSIRLITVKIS